VLVVLHHRQPNRVQFQALVVECLSKAPSLRGGRIQVLRVIHQGVACRASTSAHSLERASQ